CRCVAGDKVPGIQTLNILSPRRGRMNDRRRQHIRLSRPSRAEESKSELIRGVQPCGFPHGHAAVLPSGATR
ncbi:MAG: hypothetical protein AB7H80_09010, partial [Candidatus Kapaibacterium sp.]